MEMCDLWVEDEMLGGRKSAHENVTKVHRAKITDWVFQLGAVFELNQATVHHALDVYNRHHQGLPAPPPKEKLQAQVCAALLIAHKFRARTHISPADLEYQACGNCSVKEIIHEERNILLALDFDLRYTTPQEWLHFLISRLELQENLALSDILLGQILYLIDVAVHSEGHLRFTCATLTAAAVQSVTGVNISALCQGPSTAALQGCLEWLSKFMPLVILKSTPVQKKMFMKIPEDLEYEYVSCLNEIIALECPDSV